MIWQTCPKSTQHPSIGESMSTSSGVSSSGTLLQVVRAGCALTSRVLAIAGLVAGAAGAQSAVQKWGEPPALQLEGAHDLTIDAVEGTVSKLARFKRGDVVRIVVTNLNPFLFSYDVQIADPDTVFEAKPATFFLMAFKPLGFALPDGPGGATGPSVANILSVAALDADLRKKLENAGCAAAVPPKKRTAAERAFAVSLAALEATQQGFVPLVSHSSTLLREAMKIDGAYASTVGHLHDASLAAAAIRDVSESAAGQLLTHAVNLRSLAFDLELGLPTYAARIREGLNAARANDTTFAGCKGFAALTKAWTDDDEAAGLLARMLPTLDQRRVTVLGVQSILARAATDRGLYYYVAMVKRYDRPTDVSVSLLRTPTPPLLVDLAGLSPIGSSRADEDGDDGPSGDPKPAGNDKSGVTEKGAVASERFVTTRVRFGGRPRLTIGAGVMIGLVPNTEFVATHRLASVPGQMPRDTSILVIGRGDASSFRVVPAVTLSMLTLPFRDSDFGGLAVTLGTGLRTQGNGTSLDYFLGLGLTFLEARCTLIGGLYTGQQQQLRGHYLGEVIPTEDVPTETRNVLSGGFGLSFRIY